MGPVESDSQMNETYEPDLFSESKYFQYESVGAVTYLI